MKNLMRLYDNCRVAIRIVYFAFVLIAFGYLIQNKNVNIFYTFTSPILLTIAKGAYELGRTIVLNMPLLFMTNLVCKRANSGVPIVLSIVGYLTFLITVSLYTKNSLPSYAYMSSMGGFLTTSNAIMPYETGLLGSMAVAFATRYAFLRSRHRGQYNILGFLNRDTFAVIVNVLLCVALGMLFAYVYPIAFGLLSEMIHYIAANLQDERRLALYGLLDRSLSIVGMGNLVRYPFWFLSEGGSYSSYLTGQAVYGDVNIWSNIQDATSTFSGCGRFITPYYVINMFICPAVLVGQHLSMSDRKERQNRFVLLLLMIGLSVAAGNPLPLELSLLFTAPLLLVLYLAVVSVSFGVLSHFGIFLGFKMISSDAITAMPGTFPDYIINLRNVRLSSNVFGILYVGLAFFAIMLILTLLYYRFLAYDVFRTGATKELCEKIVLAVGGIDNIEDAGNNTLRLYLTLHDLELVSVHRIQEINARRIFETKKGLGIELGTSALILAKYIKKMIKENKRR